MLSFALICTSCSFNEYIFWTVLIVILLLLGLMLKDQAACTSVNGALLKKLNIICSSWELPTRLCRQNHLHRFRRLVSTALDSITCTATSESLSLTNGRTPCVQYLAQCFHWLKLIHNHPHHVKWGRKKSFHQTTVKVMLHLNRFVVVAVAVEEVVGQRKLLAVTVT